MLPGWDCLKCHRAGGEADDRGWSFGGTIFQNDDTAMTCNPGGPGGVKVEILDEADQVVLTLTTNNVGNFFSSEDVYPPRFRARITKGSLAETMPDLQTNRSCNGCHNPTAVDPATGDPMGRITLE
jgi:hypothetical protein